MEKEDGEDNENKLMFIECHPLVYVHKAGLKLLNSVMQVRSILMRERGIQLCIICVELKDYIIMTPKYSHLMGTCTSDRASVQGQTPVEHRE